MLMRQYPPYLIVGWKHNLHIVGAWTNAGGSGGYNQWSHSCGRSRLDSRLNICVAPWCSCKLYGEQDSSVQGVARLQEMAPAWEGSCCRCLNVDGSDYSCDRDTATCNVGKGLLQV